MSPVILAHGEWRRPLPDPSGPHLGLGQFIAGLPRDPSRAVLSLEGTSRLGQFIPSLLRDPSAELQVGQRPAAGAAVDQAKPLHFAQRRLDSA